MMLRAGHQGEPGVWRRSASGGEREEEYRGKASPHVHGSLIFDRVWWEGRVGANLSMFKCQQIILTLFKLWRCPQKKEPSLPELDWMPFSSLAVAFALFIHVPTHTHTHTHGKPQRARNAVFQWTIPAKSEVAAASRLSRAAGDGARTAVSPLQHAGSGRRGGTASVLWT